MPLGMWWKPKQESPFPLRFSSWKEINSAVTPADQLYQRTIGLLCCPQVAKTIKLEWQDSLSWYLMVWFSYITFCFSEVSNPPSAPSSEKQSPMAHQHSPKAQLNTAASLSNQAVTEPSPSASQPNPMPHQSPVTQLPAPTPQTYTHESR